MAASTGTPPAWQKESVELSAKPFHIVSEIDAKLAEAAKQRASLLHERSTARIKQSLILLAESHRALKSAEEILSREPKKLPARIRTQNGDAVVEEGLTAAPSPEATFVAVVDA